MLPSVRADAPGRVNLIGEHLDYNGGSCVPIALDRRTTVHLDASPSDLDEVIGQLPGVDGSAHVRGVLRALGVPAPVRVRIDSDVPVGAGLASSAALTCATALAANAAFALGRSTEELLRAAIEAENDHVGVPTGSLDQTIALYATSGSALVLDFADDTRTPLPWRPGPAGLTLLVIDTGVRHEHAGGEYAGRRAQCEQAAAVLGVRWLARSSEDDLSRLEGALLPRARHVVTEQARVRAFVAALADDAWGAVGALMTASHASLRDDFEVSCPELDAVVSAALDAGAAGARMTGGGFGGSAIALVPTGRVDAVREAVLADPVWNGREAPSAENRRFWAVGASHAAEVRALY